MKRLIFFIFSFLILIISCLGCAKDEKFITLETTNVKARPVDANKDGTIDDKDMLVLDELATQIYQDKILPLLLKAGISDISELYTPEGGLKVRTRLTVAEYESLKKYLDEWQKVNAQTDATVKEIADRIIKPSPIKSGKVVACHVWGVIELADGTVIKFAGIQMPAGGTNNKFSRIATLFVSRLVNDRIVRYELTGKKVGNVNEAYIYINEMCINEELVRRGYALAIRDQSERSKKLISFEEEAKENNRGLWAFYPEQDPFALDTLF